MQISAAFTKEVRAVLLLVLWELWKHRNAVVFDGELPSLHQLMRRVEAEGRTWARSGLIKANVDFVFAGLARWISGEE